MVTAVNMALFSWPNLLAEAKAAEGVLELLDPWRRVAVVMALLGIILIGLFLIVFAMLGGHWVRRLARHRPGANERRRRESAKQSEQLREALKPIVPEAKSDDTVEFRTSSKDTKVGG